MESIVAAAGGAPRPGERHVPELDGVRALAILSVMAAHLLVVTPALTHAASGLPRALARVVDHGWLGVDLFFVLSGFLITSILLAAKGGGAPAYFGRFYERRALRILPLLALLLPVLAIAYVPLTGPAYFVLCALFAANLAPLLHVAVPNGGGPLWSLAVEEQFYLIWPVLVLLLDRRKLVLVLLAVVAIEPVLRALGLGELEFTWLRCDGLAWGALLALWFSSPRRTRAGDDRLALALLGSAAALVLASIPFGGLHAGYVSSALRIPEALCVFAALVVVGISHSGAPALALLRVPFAVVTADFSYCLYLIHVPLIDAYQTVVGRYLPALPAALGPLGNNLVRATVVLVVAYALAALSRRYVELPFLTLGRRRTQLRRPSTSSG
jgi:peptidoglycan/LPS O-acetylase OafA/YrhL